MAEKEPKNIIYKLPIKIESFSNQPVSISNSSKIEPIYYDLGSKLASLIISQPKTSLISDDLDSKLLSEPLKDSKTSLISKNSDSKLTSEPLKDLKISLVSENSDPKLTIFLKNPKISLNSENSDPKLILEDLNNPKASLISEDLKPKLTSDFLNNPKFILKSENSESNLTPLLIKIPKTTSISEDLGSISTSDSSESSDRLFKVSEILKKHGLSLCKEKILRPMSEKDCEGYIYAYYSKSKPGMFKVGRSKNLPYRRIESQEKHNFEKYKNKESFHCCFHHLVESCIHLELKNKRVRLSKKQDGYTEWFQIDWDPLKKKIKSVIGAILEIFIENLIIFSFNQKKLS